MSGEGKFIKKKKQVCLPLNFTFLIDSDVIWQHSDELKASSFTGKCLATLITGTATSPTYNNPDSFSLLTDLQFADLFES